MMRFLAPMVGMPSVIHAADRDACVMRHGAGGGAGLPLARIHAGGAPA